MKSEKEQNLIQEISNLKNGIQDELKALNDLEDEVEKKLFLIKQNISSKIEIKFIDKPYKRIYKLKKEERKLIKMIIILITLVIIFIAFITFVFQILSELIKSFDSNKKII